MDVHLLRFYLDLGKSQLLMALSLPSGLRAHIILSMARIHAGYSCYYYVVALIITRAGGPRT